MKVGDTVRIIDDTVIALEALQIKTLHDTAKIVIILEEPYKGGICLDRPLYDIRYWNVADLEIVEDENV